MSTERIELGRRAFLRAGLAGAGTGLLAGLGRAGLIAPAGTHLTGRAGRAKHCIFLFMFGGPAQMDLFDLQAAAAAPTTGKTIRARTPAQARAARRR